MQKLKADWARVGTDTKIEMKKIENKIRAAASRGDVARSLSGRRIQQTCKTLMNERK